MAKKKPQSKTTKVKKEESTKKPTSSSNAPKKKSSASKESPNTNNEEKKKTTEKQPLDPADASVKESVPQELKPKAPPKISTKDKKAEEKQKKKEQKKKQREAKKERLKKKIEKFKKKAKNTFFPREIQVKGKEPPPSYSFERKFYGLYLMFLAYSFILLLAINDPGNPVIVILTFGNPYSCALAILSFFLLFSIIINNDKLRTFIFDEKTAQKQLGIFVPTIAGFFLLYEFIIKTSVNFISTFLVLSMIWLFLLSTRFYTYSRKFSTKIESRFIKRYSPFRYFIALITPFVILGVLVVIALFYRALLVFIALDFFNISDPAGAEVVYSLEMNLIMPLIYFSLILTLLFIIFEFVFTRRRAETKRAGSFDNFTFSLIVLFIFFFQLFQVTIFLLVRPETVSALRNSTLGSSDSTSSMILSIVFLAEFIISMYFLYRIVTKLGSLMGWRVLFFKKDGFIIFILACVFAQSVTRFVISSDLFEEDLTTIATWLSFDRYIISVLMIIFLGLTLLIYYLKPQQTSMFMRLQKETVKEEEKSMDQIYSLIRTEYIRRGEPYPIEILDRELMKSTKLSKGIVRSLIKRLAEKDMDIEIIQRKDKNGKIKKYIDFLSVTETFEKKDVARKKAKKYMTQKFTDTITSQKRKTIRLSKDKLDDEKASDQFIASLTSDYRKKQEDQEKISKAKEGKKEETVVSFRRKEIPISLKNNLLKVLKEEFTFRIENEEDYPSIEYPISEIATDIQMKTGINPGDLYPLLENMNAEKDLEFSLKVNPEHPEDKLVSFFPIASDNLCYSLKNFRPEQYSEFKKRITARWLEYSKRKKTNSTLNNLKRDIPKKSKQQKLWRKNLTILANYFAPYSKQRKYIPNRMKLRNQMEEYAATIKKKEEEATKA